MPSPVASTKEFLVAIWGDQEGICSIAFGRPDPQKPEKTKGFSEKPFLYPGELDNLLAEIPKANGKQNIYFGVCLKREKWPRPSGKIGGDGKPEVEKRATEANALSATAIWTDIDYKDTPQEKAIKNLKAFPLKASIGVLSGGGIQAFWLLKEPATTPDELARVKRLNAALSRVLGGDHTQDTARVLRMPGTLNVKYTPAREATLAQGTWRPLLKYTLDDIEQYLPLEFLQEGTVPMTAAAPQKNPAGPPIPEVIAPPPGATHAIEVGTLPVPDSIKKIIREGLPAFIDHRKAVDTPEKFAERDRMKKMSRSEADAYVITQLVYANLSDGDIYALYRDPNNRVGEKYREKKNGDKYLGLTIRKAKNYKAQHPRTPLDKVADKIGYQMVREEKIPDIEVMKLVKWNYEEPLWDVLIRHTDTGEENTVNKCKHLDFARFSRFNEAYLAQHNKHLSSMKQEAWGALVNGAEVEIKEVEEEVRTTEGEVIEALDEWLGQAQTEANEATIQYLPVFIPNENKVYMRLPAFMQYVSSQKIDTKRKEVIRIVKASGFELGTQRFGKKPIKVWALDRNGNGRNNGNGHPTGEQEGDSDPSTAPEQTPQTELPPPSEQTLWDDQDPETRETGQDG